MTRRSADVDILVEKAILYIERNPHVSAADLRNAGYHPVVDRVKGNVNSLKEKAGVPPRERGSLYSDGWEKLENRFRKYLAANPNATEPEIRGAGLGGVFRNRFYGDMELVRNIFVEGKDLYTTQQIMDLLGSSKGAVNRHLKKSGAKRVKWGVYSGPEVRSYARSLGIDVPYPESPAEVPLVEPITQALVRIYTSENAAEILGVSTDKLPELTLRNGIHNIDGRYFADSVDWLKRKLDRCGELETPEQEAGGKENTVDGDVLRTYNHFEAGERLGVHIRDINNLAIENSITIYKGGRLDANGIDILAERLEKMLEFKPPAWSAFVKTGVNRERPQEPEVKPPTRGRPRSPVVDENVRAAVFYLENNPLATREDMIKAGYKQALNRFRGITLRKLAGVPDLRGCPDGAYLQSWEPLEKDLTDYLGKNPDATEPEIRSAGYSGVFRHRFGSDIEKARKGENVETTSQGPDVEIVDEETKNPVKETTTAGPGVIVYIDDGIEYNPSKPDTIIGQNERFRKALKLASRVSSENIDALVIGETGTGKDLIVKYIHNEGARSSRPFVVYNCYRTDLDRNHVIGELFGFRVGAGASRKGIIELAGGGDLVLEDLQHLSDFGQLAFEDFLSDRRITILGKGDKEVNVRFLSVADNSLKDKVKEGEFKNGLYYKLGRVIIDVPPLRERVDDIMLLASYFLDKHSKLQGRSRPRLSLAEVTELVRRDWEGNVKQLENYMETSVLSGEIVIPQADYPADEKRGDVLKDVVTFKEGEEILIEKAMEKANGNKVLAAQMLGIGESTLYKRLKEHKP